MLGQLVDVFAGGLGGKIVDAFQKYFPPDMSPEMKAQIALEAQNFELKVTMEANRAREEAEKSINERIAMYEGSSSDLKGIPFIGPLMLLLRGSQRIAWGFGTLLLDYNVFSSNWKLIDPVISNAFWIVNFLVLGFLFGERAVTNVMPFFTRMIEAKQGAVK